MNGFHAKSTLTHTILQPCLWTNGKRYVVALVFRETLGRAAETPSKDTVGLDAFLSCVGPARSSHGLESNSRVLIYVVWRTHAHTHTHTPSRPAASTATASLSNSGHWAPCPFSGSGTVQSFCFDLSVLTSVHAHRFCGRRSMSSSCSTMPLG